MQSKDQPAIAGDNSNIPEQSLISLEGDQVMQDQSSLAEEIKSDIKQKRQRKPKIKDSSIDLPQEKNSCEKVKRPRQSKKVKEGQDGAQDVAHSDSNDLKDKLTYKTDKKRKQKEESKTQKKEGQPKIESLFKQCQFKNEEAKNHLENDKQLNPSIPAKEQIDVIMEENHKTITTIMEQKDSKKPKKEKKGTPQKMEQMIVLPEKVLEWKSKKDHFSSILRDVINQGHDGREKHSNTQAGQMGGAQEQNALSDELKVSLKNNLIRNLNKDLPISEQQSQFQELEIDISKSLACVIENSELSLAKLTVKCLEYLKTQLSNEKEYPQISECLSKSLDLQQLILRNAERRSYGVRDFANTIYECEAHQALWFWEMANTSHFPTQEMQKAIKNERNQRQALQEKVKCLDKVMRLIEKAKEEKDLPKIVEEQEKYNKILRRENAALQQQIEKDRQLREKEQQERQKQEQIQKEREQKEQERLQKEQQKELEKQLRDQERLQKEQERLRLLKEKEDQKEKERAEKERQAQEKLRQKEQERLEKQQRLELKRKQEEETKLETQNPNPSKIQKTAQAPVQTNTILRMFSKSSIEPKAAPIVNKLFAEDTKILSQSENQLNKKEVFPRPFKLVNPNLKGSQMFESESVKLQRRFRELFGHSLVSQNEPYPNKQIFKQFFKTYGALDVQSKPKERKKCIIIEDSFMKYFGVFDKKSAFLDPRRPLMKDETLIDYDMSSEEEWNEQNGEDVNKENQEDDAEDDEIEKMLMEEEQENQSEADFIVPDDYISASELMLSQQEGSQVQQELNQRREAYANRYSKQFNSMNPNLQHYVFLQDSKERGVINYLKEYRAVSFPKTAQFPLQVKPTDDGEGANQDDKNGGTGSKLNSKAINTKLGELVKMMHGSFQSKQKIIDDFNQKYPECSRKSIEKKMRDLFEKDKKQEDPRQRWYATESTLIELNLQDDEELKTLFNERLQEVLEEIKKADEEALKAKEEKNAIKQLQKQEKIQERMELKELQKQEAAAAKAEKAAEKASNQANTLLTPNKQPRLQFKEAESKQKSQFMTVVGSNEKDHSAQLQTLMEVDTEQSTANSNNQQAVNAPQSQGLDKPSSEKTTMSKQTPPLVNQTRKEEDNDKSQSRASKKGSTVKQDKDKHIEQGAAVTKRDQAPKVVLTNFFKKTDPIEKEKAVQAEQQRTNDLVKKQKELETLRRQNEVAVARIAATIVVENVEETAGIILKQIKSHDQQMTINQFTSGVNLAGKQTQAKATASADSKDADQLGSSGVQTKVKKTKASKAQSDVEEVKQDATNKAINVPITKTKAIKKSKNELQLTHQQQESPKEDAQSKLKTKAKREVSSKSTPKAEALKKPRSSKKNATSENPPSELAVNDMKMRVETEEIEE